jgi:hypothetical protein
MRLNWLDYEPTVRLLVKGLSGEPEPQCIQIVTVSFQH